MLRVVKLFDQSRLIKPVTGPHNVILYVHLISTNRGLTVLITEQAACPSATNRPLKLSATTQNLRTRRRSKAPTSDRIKLLNHFITHSWVSGVTRGRPAIAGLRIWLGIELGLGTGIADLNLTASYIILYATQYVRLLTTRTYHISYGGP